MKAVFQIKNGEPEKAFEIREVQKPVTEPLHIRIKVSAFGLNFADVMARLGMYPDAPKKPGVLGYDVVGHVDEIGSEVSTDLQVGDRVIALTRFGGYAEYASTDYRGVVRIAEGVSPAAATALATQGGTAYFMAYDMVRIHKGDRVLVHAAAGGVGSLLCQMAKHQGAYVYGTAGAPAKIEYLKKNGVDFPINYRSQAFQKEIQAHLKDQDSGLDIVFDPVGGDSVKKGMKLLGSGGRMVLFGASSMTSAKSVFGKLKVAKGFGIYSPIGLLSPSKSLIGVNMLRIADDKPEVLHRVLKDTVRLYDEGVLHPEIGGEYSIGELNEAHSALENRKTMGKIAILWD